MDTPERHDLAEALQRRARGVRRARLVVLLLVIGYFFLPYDIQAFIPVWVPFLLALGLEANFFIGGHLQARHGRPSETPDRGPQARDLADLGGDPWLETHAVSVAGEQHLVPTEGLLTEEEIHERLGAYLDDPEATIAEVEEAAEPEQPYVAPPRSYRSHVLEALAGITLVAGILFYAAQPHGWDAVSGPNRARAEALFSKQAGLIAGHPANVVCDTGGTQVGAVQEADGLAMVGGADAYLTPSICNTLYQLAFKNRVQSFPATGRAIAVLAHESWHLHGVASEGLANCYAFQSGVDLGVRLGLSRSTAKAMMREQLGSNALDSTSNPQYVVPPGCTDGGEYDLNPDVSGFP